MKKWWNEKDFITIIPEKIIRNNLSAADTVEMIYKDIAQ